MQLMLAAFGRILSLSANLDRAGDDPQLVCIGSSQLELADDESPEPFGFRSASDLRPS